jgi:hypothetical protein
MSTSEITDPAVPGPGTSESKEDNPNIYYMPADPNSPLNVFQLTGVVSTDVVDYFMENHHTEGTFNDDIIFSDNSANRGLAGIALLRSRIRNPQRLHCFSVANVKGNRETTVKLFHFFGLDKFFKISANIDAAFLAPGSTADRAINKTLGDTFYQDILSAHPRVLTHIQNTGLIRDHFWNSPIAQKILADNPSGAFDGRKHGDAVRAAIMEAVHAVTKDPTITYEQWINEELTFAKNRDVAALPKKYQDVLANKANKRGSPMNAMKLATDLEAVTMQLVCASILVLRGFDKKGGEYAAIGQQVLDMYATTPELGPELFCQHYRRCFGWKASFDFSRALCDLEPDDIYHVAGAYLAMTSAFPGKEINPESVPVQFVAPNVLQFLTAKQEFLSVYGGLYTRTCWTKLALNTKALNSELVLVSLYEELLDAVPKDHPIMQELSELLASEKARCNRIKDAIKATGMDKKAIEIAELDNNTSTPKELMERLLAEFNGAIDIIFSSGGAGKRK